MNFKEKIEYFFNNCENPQVYTGKELNVVRNNFRQDQLNICLVFPDKYEIGMSHYGIKLLYHLLNGIDNVNVERCFLPDQQSIALLRHIDLPLFSIENKIPLGDFDIIGFSLLSEMNFTNLIAVLDLAQMPLYTKERNQPGQNRWPIIAAGGISAINPEPIRSLVDIFAIGDGEALFPILIDNLKQYKSNHISRIELFTKIQSNAGFYVPSLHQLLKNGPFLRPDLPNHSIQKVHLHDLNQSLSNDSMIVPITNVVFDRLDIEIARGCPQNCRFCQAKTYYSPYRYKSPDTNLKSIKDGLNSTGFESAGLSTLSAGDYPHIENLLSKIPECIPNSTDISMSSLRPSAISDKLLSTISQFRRTGITIVPEAGSVRLRNVINKNVTDREIFDALETALKFGWQKIKLYFMIGLPTETDDDIYAISNLIIKMIDIVRSRKKRIKITASFSSFVPKPHTALQWAKRESKSILIRRIKILRAELHRFRFLELDFHKVDRGIVETVLARGDNSIEPALVALYRRGEIFSSWDDAFHYEIWLDEFEKFDYQKFLTELDPFRPLPWDFIEIHFKHSFLSEDYQAAKQSYPSINCFKESCAECKKCAFPFKKYKLKLENIDTITDKPIVQTEYNRVRVTYKKTDDFIYFSHLSMSKYIERIIRRSGIGFKSTEGFRPRIKIAYLPPLPVYAKGHSEVFEFFADKSLSSHDILDNLKKSAGELPILNVFFCNDKKALNRDIALIHYRVSFVPEGNVVEKIKELLRPGDLIDIDKESMQLTIDYSDQGPEQFSRIYRLIDPEKKMTSIINREKICFK